MSFVKFSKDGEISVGNVLFNIRKFQNVIDKKSTVFIQVTKPKEYSIIDFWYDPKNDILCVAKPLNGKLSWVQVELAGAISNSKNVIPGPIGYVGSRGLTGYNGSVGYTGSAGLRGFSGYTGSIGPTGFTGSIGFVGSLGYTGSTGLTGTSIDHIKFLSTEDLTGYPNVHGALDTYVAYADVDETVIIGTFKLINGTDAYKEAVKYGYTGTKEKFYQDLYSTGDRLQNSETLFTNISGELETINNDITTISPHLLTLENVNTNMDKLTNIESNLAALNIISANLTQALSVENLTITPIYYVEAGIGQTDFNFNYGDYDSVKVYYNGRLLSNVDWSGINGTIIRLAEPVDIEGDIVAIEGLNRIGAVDLVSSKDLQNLIDTFYNKIQVDGLINNINTITDNKLLQYFNKSEIDSIIQVLKNEINNTINALKTELLATTGSVTDFEQAMI